MLSPIYMFPRQMQTHPRARTLVVGLSLLVVMGLLAGCGSVITLSPTPTPPPTATLSVNVVVATLNLAHETPAPYTPEATYTPTVTPTPIVHAIQSGETLLSVASQYDVSVSALQDANGILKPAPAPTSTELIIPRGRG